MYRRDRNLSQKVVFSFFQFCVSIKSSLLLNRLHKSPFDIVWKSVNKKGNVGRGKHSGEDLIVCVF